LNHALLQISVLEGEEWIEDVLLGKLCHCLARGHIVPDTTTNFKNQKRVDFLGKMEKFLTKDLS
jgi:hypothetical protein